MKSLSAAFSATADAFLSLSLFLVKGEGREQLLCNQRVQHRHTKGSKYSAQQHYSERTQPQSVREGMANVLKFSEFIEPRMDWCGCERACSCFCHVFPFSILRENENIWRSLRAKSSCPERTFSFMAFYAARSLRSRQQLISPFSEVH